MSLKQSLYNRIKQEGYVSRDDLRRYARELNYDSSSCDRKCRELTHNDSIKPKTNTKGFIVGYYYNSNFYEMFQEEVAKLDKQPEQSNLL